MRRSPRLAPAPILLLLTLTACTVTRPGAPLEFPPGPAPAAVTRTLKLGQTLDIQLSLGGRTTPPEQFRWTSTRPEIATVTPGGVVRAVGVGTATVRATSLARPALFTDFQIVVAARPAVAPDPTPALDALGGRVLALTNAARARGQRCGATAYPPAPPLRASTRLGAAAQAHASDMAAREYFNHVSPEGRALDARIDASGYRWGAIAENIAAGQATPEEVVAGWLGSEGHCRNLMNAAYTDLGIGTATASPSAKRYWVQDFAAPRD